jgi:hypothetical protein
MTKIARSGSTSQRHGSTDPDPYQNVTNPQHCHQVSFGKDGMITLSQRSDMRNITSTLILRVLRGCCFVLLLHNKDRRVISCFVLLQHNKDRRVYCFVLLLHNKDIRVYRLLRPTAAQQGYKSLSTASSYCCTTRI